MTPHSLSRFTFALLVALPLYAQAETGDAPPPPDRNSFRAKGPMTAEVPVAKPVLPGDAPTVTWTDAEVAKAKLDCAKKLAGVTLDYEALPPIKEGICGAPAPILVTSIGGVAIDPAATMTCALASGLSAWINKTLQPQAKAILGTQVVKLHNATSYACRNRYGGETTPLSEHALANALDISEFVFETGEKVTVLGSWARVAAVPPPVAADTTGSITPSAAPRPPAIEAVEVTKVKVSAKTNPFVLPTAIAKSPPRPPAIEAVEVAKVKVSAKTNPFVLPTAIAKSPPPPPPAEATEPGSQSASERKGEFVKNVHDDACKIFGTVLGPEANEAHKNHFHFDMKARRRTSFCE